MQLHLIDSVIIGIYLLAVVWIGLLMKKRASKSMNSYFLGGKTLPWYMLGLSNASGMFDISGTMWMVYLAFVYGLKSIWIPWLWPVFNQIFLMVFLAAWLRRSNVLTGAEWIRTRFGNGKGATLSHVIVVIFALVCVLGYLSYGFIGIGKFIAIFMPWDINPNYYGIAFTAIATFYVMMGGMLSIVWADVLQFTIMTVSCFIVAFIAIDRVDLGVLQSMVPAGWDNPFFGWTLDLDWDGLVPALNQIIEKDGYSLFSIFFMMMVFKGVLVSLAGPAPNYDMQKILATKSPKEASKMSGFVSLVLLMPRYLMITGFAVLGIVYFSDEFNALGNQVDFEIILPKAIKEFVPVGVMGLMLAGLLAAFMSTFAATTNAAPAYIVNDIYLRYINPNAPRKTQIYASYIISVAVVAISTVMGLYIENINAILQWIVSALFGGYTAANVLKWYWWRFNGYGYFWGMATGIGASLVFPILFSGTLDLYYFPLLLLVSVIGSLVGSLATPPTDEKVLMEFYKRVRPWGFWGPIHEKVMAANPQFQKNTAFKRDMFNVVVGIIWQTSLVTNAVYLVVGQYMYMAISVVITLVSMLILKLNWYDKLEDEVDTGHEVQEKILA
jgi:Na+/proline symporter